jgi:hypothetical protein
MEPIADQADARNDRRSFLAQMGKTLAVGLGISAVTGAAASASTTTCAIFCSPVAGSCESACCQDPPPCPLKLFHCTTLCGYDYYQCMDHGCSGFCFSQNAC